MSGSAAHYPHRPIHSVEALCSALRVHPQQLRAIAQIAPQLYRGPIPKPKKRGNGVRYVYDTNDPLKPLLRRINQVFFREIKFPAYLHGSIKGCDFISNADVHKCAATVIKEDIKGFFDHITAEHAYDIWRRFFGFGSAPAELLTQLVTTEGKVRQGAPTSPYLANLVFWDIEPRIVEAMAMRGFRYSRFVDDVSLSCIAATTNEDKSWVISQLYGMLGARGFRPARTKHQILNGREPRQIMGLNISAHLTFTKEERRGTRAMVHQLEQRARAGENTVELRDRLISAAGKVARLGRLHEADAVRLRPRLKAVQALLDSPQSREFTASSAASTMIAAPVPGGAPPF